jgi:hypothetical protein
MVFTILFCAIAIVAAGLDLAHGAPKFWQDVLVIPVAASTLFIRRFRIFCWALFGVFFTWAVILGLALVAIFGVHTKPADPIIHGVLVVLLCLPPLIITVCVDLALHRMRPNQTIQPTADRPYA